ncbi:unnamed protein product [Linum tenue]|uniref:Transposase Tnp1/En/Spm-like domain-containing protein n=2 Tax=Linum tenue TaxID=586396 RepID=A0AAV0H092_9ROSI|nr:unnamed protein product [Linum tenue]
MSPTGFGREEENLGRSPLLSMLQDTTPQRTNSQSNEVSPNHILQTYLPHYHGLSSEVNSSLIQNKTSQMPPNKTFSFLDSILDSSHNGGSSTQSQGLEFAILKSLLSPEVNVAYANIMTKDPKGCVAGQELGRGFYEVFIHVPFKSDEPLVRLYGSFRTIGDVIGRSIAWPSSLVTLADTQLF